MKIQNPADDYDYGYNDGYQDAIDSHIALRYWPIALVWFLIGAIVVNTLWLLLS